MHACMRLLVCRNWLSWVKATAHASVCQQLQRWFFNHYLVSNTHDSATCAALLVKSGNSRPHTHTLPPLHPMWQHTLRSCYRCCVVVLQVNGQLTPDLDTFLSVVAPLKDGDFARVKVCHLETTQQKVCGHVRCSRVQLSKP